jgi:hypothetical protein
MMLTATKTKMDMFGLTKKIKSALHAYVCWLKVLDGKHH